MCAVCLHAGGSVDVVQWAMGCSVCCRVWTQQAVQQSVWRTPSPRVLQHQAVLPWYKLQHGSCCKEGVEYNSHFTAAEHP